MADPILIAPDNRLLGWALSDLSLYGGQPAPGIAIGRAPDESIVSLAPAPAVAAPAPAEPEGEIASRETVALLEADETQPAGQTSASLPASLTPAIAPAAPAEPVAVPLPVGSGSIVSPPISTPLQAVTDARTDAAPGSDQPVPPSVTNAEPVQLAAIPPGPSAGVIDLGPGASTVVNSSFAQLDALSAPAADLSAATDAAMTRVVETLDTLVEPAAPLSESVTTTLSDTNGVASVLDTPIESFSGDNPAAGLMTLIGMVGSADAFELGEAIAPAPAASASGSILDTLAADDVPAALLGGEAAGIDHPIDDAGIHVGL